MAESRGVGLAHSASRGVMLTVGGLWGKTAIQLISTVVLARLLEPSDYGLIAMIMAIIGLVDLVRDFGLSAAILQAKDISQKQWNSLLWVSIGLGVILMVLVMASAPLIVAFYGEDRLLVLVLAVAPTLLINGLAMPIQAMIQRDLRFGTLAAIDVTTMIVSVAFGIGGALLGFGVWSLVILAGSGLFYRLIALWVCARPRFGRPEVTRSVWPMLVTGADVLGVQVLGYATRNLDNVVIGQHSGVGALGQYSRAYALFLLPLQQINGPLVRVALPVLSKIQDDSERYRQYIRGSFTVIGYVTFTVYAVSAAIAEPLIRILLGPGWSQAATVFAILSLAGVAQVVANVQGWLYITLRRTRQQLYYTLFHAAVIISAFIVGVRIDGVEGLAWAYGIASLALLIPGMWLAIAGTFVKVTDIIVPLSRPALIAPCAYALSAWAVNLAGVLPAIVQVVAGGLAGVLVLGIAHALPSVRKDTKTVLGFVQMARRKA